MYIQTVLFTERWNVNDICTNTMKKVHLRILFLVNLIEYIIQPDGYRRYVWYLFTSNIVQSPIDVTWRLHSKHNGGTWTISAPSDAISGPEKSSLVKLRTVAGRYGLYIRLGTNDICDRMTWSWVNTILLIALCWYLVYAQTIGIISN